MLPVFVSQAAPPAIVAPAVSLTAAEKSMLAKITQATIKRVTTELVAPSMEGRGTASPGGEKAARYLASIFQQMGLSPAGDDGTFLQKVPFRVSELAKASLSFGENTLVVGKDFVPLPSRAPGGPSAAPIESDAIVVVAPEPTGEIFGKEEISGKVVLIFLETPDGFSPDGYARRAQEAAQAAIQKGAKAVLLFGNSPTLPPYATLSSFVVRRSVSPAPANASAPTETAPAAPRPVQAILSESGFATLARGNDLAELRAKAKSGRKIARTIPGKLSLLVSYNTGIATGYNVVARLDGASPTKRDEALLFSAHYDAFGKTPDGTIFPGAADNALGVAEMVAIAEGLKAARPPRSVLFLAVTGEEYGLLGSRYWAEHPTHPLEKVVANFNFDGIGTEVWGPLAQVTGFGAEYSTLGTTFAGALASLKLKPAADPFPEERVFTRSDHFSFVRKGVPALMLLGMPAGNLPALGGRAKKWMETGDYHNPGDTIRPEWNWLGPEMLARAGALAAFRVAVAPDAPRWLENSPYQRK